MSHPTRVRGLKPMLPSDFTKDIPSHPTRVRGLKQVERTHERKFNARRTPRGCVD